MYLLCISLAFYLRNFPETLSEEFGKSGIIKSFTCFFAQSAKLIILDLSDTVGFSKKCPNAKKMQETKKEEK
jgi:hypothetical protein